MRTLGISMELLVGFLMGLELAIIALALVLVIA